MKEREPNALFRFSTLENNGTELEDNLSVTIVKTESASLVSPVFKRDKATDDPFNENYIYWEIVSILEELYKTKAKLVLSSNWNECRVCNGGAINSSSTSVT